VIAANYAAMEKSRAIAMEFALTLRLVDIAPIWLYKTKVKAIFLGGL